MFKTSQSKTLEIVEKMLSDLKVKTKGTSRSTACTISRNGKEIVFDENTDSDTVSSVSSKHRQRAENTKTLSPAKKEWLWYQN